MVLHLIAFVCFSGVNIWFSIAVVNSYFWAQMALDVPNTGHSKNGHSFIWSQGIYDGWVTITLLLIGLGCCCVLNKNHEKDDRIFKDEVEEKYDENKSGKEEFDYV